MMKQCFKAGRQLLAGIGLASALVLGVSQPAAALTANADYNVVVYKVNSDGSRTSVSSTSATADANGKIQFSLSSLPTADEANFVFIEIKDSNDNVVRRAFSPAPPAGSTNSVGVNEVSDIQAQAIQTSMADNGTDDPMGVAFGLVFVRSPNIQSGDIDILADMMGTAILGTGGMEDFLVNNGVSSSQLETFKDNIVANRTDTSSTNDMADYMAFFKTAVDNDSDNDMAKAGGVMADVFMDAAIEADIDPGLILAAFEAAGSVPGLQTLMTSLSNQFAASIEQAVTGFFTRIAAVKMKKEYTDALDTLDASGSEVDRFNSAVQSFVSAQQAIDIQYGEFFMDPDGYVASSGKTRQQIQTEIDQAFQNAWSSFQSDMASSGAEISAMQSAVSTATGIPLATLQNDNVGKECDFSCNDPTDPNQLSNWPIPQTVSVSWVAEKLSAGGDFTYTRDDLPVPNNMASWLDSDEDPNNGIDGQRTDFTDPNLGMPAAFAALMGLMQDVQIVEHTRFEIWDGGGNPTPDQIEAARLAYISNLNDLVDNIGGTTDGSTAISTAAKKALVKLMQEPSLH